MQNREELIIILNEYVVNNWINPLIFFWVLKRKLCLVFSPLLALSSRCCVINCCMNFLIANFGPANLLTMVVLKFYNFIIWTFFLWLSFYLRFPLFYRDLCWGFIRTRVKIVSFKTSFRPWIKTNTAFTGLTILAKTTRKTATISSYSFSLKY